MLATIFSIIAVLLFVCSAVCQFRGNHQHVGGTNHAMWCLVASILFSVWASGALAFAQLVD